MIAAELKESHTLMLRVHFAPNSPADRIVWVLRKLRWPHEPDEMAFHPKDLNSDEHQADRPGSVTGDVCALSFVSYR